MKEFEGYIFTRIEVNGSKVQVKVPLEEGIYLPDLLRQFSYFLEGCSFSLPNCDNKIVINYEDEIE